MQILGLLSDLILICATLGLAAWCRLLSTRLRTSDGAARGDDGTIAALALRVEDLEASIAAASSEKSGSEARLIEANAKADDRIGRMEMLLASLEDLEEESADRLLQGAAPKASSDGIPSFRASRSPVAGGRS